MKTIESDVISFVDYSKGIPKDDGERLLNAVSNLAYCCMRTAFLCSLNLFNVLFILLLLIVSFPI